MEVEIIIKTSGVDPDEKRCWNRTQPLLVKSQNLTGRWTLTGALY